VTLKANKFSLFVLIINWKLIAVLNLPLRT
jgi:hypothetical protein